MAKKKPVLLSLLLCALVPAVAATIISPFLGVSVFIAAFLLASLVGYPLFLIFRHYFYVNAWVSCAVGLVIGAAAGGYITLPLNSQEMKTTSSRGSGVERVYTMIDGVPTQAAWNDFYEACVIFGALGTLAGLVFWLVIAKPSGVAPHDKAV
jgi:ABC-type lipoprotein release transport system permease subunit